MSWVDLTLFLEVVNFFLAIFLRVYIDNMYCTFMFNSSSFNIIKELVANVHPMVWATTTYKALLSWVDLTLFLEVVNFFLATFLS
jgi:hypothetical protein